MKKRHGVLALLCCVSVITFLDRLAIPVAEPGIRAELHLSPDQWGWVLSAYILANALFEIPSGAFGDRRGQRLELTRITAWWSVFTALTGWCRTFWQIGLSRFFFGMGAAGAYPNAAGVIARWFPKAEHARAQGMVWGASRLGGALAPLILVPFSARFGWRASFWMLGSVGIVWAITWWSWFRNYPEEMHDITSGELAEIGHSTDLESHVAVPWRQMLRLSNLWLIVLAYLLYAFGSWFYFGWFTTWLVRGAGFSLSQMSLFASFPFVMGMIGNLVGGLLSERAVQRYGRKKSYRWITFCCLLVTASSLFAMSLVKNHVAIVVLATLGFGVMDLMLPAAWAMCMSLGGHFGGTATAMMNTGGNLGGWICTVAFGYIVKITGNYNLPLRVIAVAVILAALLFAIVDCTKGLQDDPRLSRNA